MATRLDHENRESTVEKANTKGNQGENVGTQVSRAKNPYGFKCGGLHTQPLQRAYGTSQPAVKPSIQRLALSMAML